MGKEEVRERKWLIYKLVYRLIESAQGNRKYRGRIGAEIGKGLDVGKFLPFTSTLIEIV
jgi:hypothetical protein